MNREELLALCERFAFERGRVLVGRLNRDAAASTDPIPEILRSFARAEISETEKNALMSLVWDGDDERSFCDETTCISDAYADELAATSDDDEVG